MVRDLQIAKFFSLATFSAAIVLSPPVNAQQQSDSFSTCFSNLSAAFDPGYALDQCKDMLAGQSLNEPFSTCFGTLSAIFDPGYALDQCKDMLAGQSPNEPFSTCFGTLSAIFDPGYALDQCKGMLAGQSPNEPFSTCFNTLSAIFDPGYANQQCRELAQNGGGSNDNRVFRMVNNTGATVEALYLAPSSGSDWGSNDLNGVLPSGRSVELTLESSSCAYDFYANLSDGRQITERQINTCDYTGYRLR
ncbi:MAG: hypothetical protein AAF215_19450 [Cyanobacteria bacterium P01_A01_bin.123]